jgi:hypothetical protein
MRQLECCKFDDDEIRNISIAHDDRLGGIVVTIEDHHTSFFKLKVVGSLFSPGKGFALLEELKSVEQILTSYSMTQSSLEHVFIKMASPDLGETVTERTQQVIEDTKKAIKSNRKDILENREVVIAAEAPQGHLL